MTSSLNKTLESKFAKILAEDRHDKPIAYDHAMRHIFKGIPIGGKSALDIGSGRGLTSCWLALKGASRVVSMEPEMEGSRSGAVQLQRERKAFLDLSNLEIITTDFQNFNTSEKFDIVVSNASINHLQESDKHALYDTATFNAFVQIATKMRQLTLPDGVVVVTDASRFGFFSLARSLGLPRKYCLYGKSINYKIHQNAVVWKKIFVEAGFRNIEISYPVPFGLRNLGVLAVNRVANFFLHGSFILRARL